MAKWIVYQNARKHLTLVYRNVLSGMNYVCGEMRSDTPYAMILQWVVEQAATRPGDIVKFPDGSATQLMPSVVERV